MPRRPPRVVRREFEVVVGNPERQWGMPCEGLPTVFVDYPKSETPTPKEAEAMCSGCPLFKGRYAGLCREYAVAIRADTGVWGGVVFEGGKPRALPAVLPEAA